MSFASLTFDTSLNAKAEALFQVLLTIESFQENQCVCGPFGGINSKIVADENVERS